MRRSRPRSSRCSTRASIRGSSSRRAAQRTRSRDPRAHRGSAAGRREPRRGPHPAALRQRRRGGAAHQLLPDRRQRPAEGGDRHQVREPQHRGHAGAAPALRDLRLFAARRRRAPAVRQGRARRPALVRPAAGLPHRGARAGQGAAGEERRHRAGRRQGRLRAEAAAGRRPARGDPDRGRRRLHAVRLEPARHHRQYRHRGRDPAAQRGAARRRRSLSGGRRRQGHRDVLRHRQRHLGAIRLLARRRLRVRRLGRLRPQEDGHHGARRLGGGEAPFPRDRRRHHDDAVHGGGRRRHVGRRVRQRHAAGADTIRLVAAFDHRDIFIDPSPDPAASFMRAQAPVRPAALELAGLQQGPDLAGRRRVSRAAPRRSSSRRRRRRCSTCRRRSRRSR